MSGKQTGRPETVKQKGIVGPTRLGFRNVALLCLTMAACSSPSGGWYQPVKNADLTQADYQACRTQAEESSLELRQERRPGYGVLGTDRPGVFNPRGDDTMAIAERSDTVSVFDALVSACMTAKGYRQDGPDVR